MEVQHQRKRRRDGGWRIVVAKKEWRDGEGRCSTERVRVVAVVGGGRRLWWQQWREREREREREKERGKSCRGAGKKKGVPKIETPNKPYGFGSFNNRSHIPLFGIGSCWTEVKHLTASSLFQKCCPLLASGNVGSRHIILFGTGFERTEAYNSLWLRVLGEPMHKTWLELQKCQCAIICFNF